jgi:hypothetical protein
MIQICYECGKEREVRMNLAPMDQEDVEPEDIEVGEGEDKRLARSIAGCYAGAFLHLM